MCGDYVEEGAEAVCADREVKMKKIMALLIGNVFWY